MTETEFFRLKVGNVIERGFIWVIEDIRDWTDQHGNPRRTVTFKGPDAPEITNWSDSWLARARLVAETFIEAAGPAPEENEFDA